MNVSGNKLQAGRVADFMAAIFSIVLLAGIRTGFSACGPKEDGTFMNCRQAEETVFVLALVLLVLSLINLLYRGRGQHGIKAGLCLSMVPLSAACARVPGAVIRLCMMETMRCHTTMRPAVLVLCLLLAAVSLAGFVLHRKECGAHHARGHHPENDS